jgi:3-oxoacyl-[acyl-carrier-protein] synthase III
VIIQSVALRIPSKCLANQDILQWIREQNRELRRDCVTRYCDKLNRLFELVGAETRYIRNKAGGERGFDLLVDAAWSAIKQAGTGVHRIDLIIYCGVGRGFLEPANAAFLAKTLGVTCDAFDVSEACMSWARALQIAYNLLATRSYSNILIVNAEFTVYEYGLPDALRIRSDERIAYSFPALTIGEATTATVVTSSCQPWKFHFRSAPAFAPLCNLPLRGYDDFCMPDKKIALNGPDQLVAFGAELSHVATREMIAFIRQTYDHTEHIALWLPHNSGETGLQTMADKLNLGDKLYMGIFRRYGNLVSASIPAAVALAVEGGRLKRGDRIVLCPATAGMAFGLIEGVY